MLSALLVEKIVLPPLNCFCDFVTDQLAVPLSAFFWVPRSVPSLSLFTFMPWRRKWQPTPAFLPGASQGRGSLVGCYLWGHTASGATEATRQQQRQVCPIALCVQPWASDLWASTAESLLLSPRNEFRVCTVSPSTLSCFLKVGSASSLFHINFRIISFILNFFFLRIFIGLELNLYTHLKKIDFFQSMEHIFKFLIFLYFVVFNIRFWMCFVKIYT